MKKGFTLIELLAVIVILAIIAVIAVPIVINIIDDSKNNASLRSADFYLDAVELAVADRVMNYGAIPNKTYPIMGDGNICLETYNKTSIEEICTDTDNIDNNEILKVEVKGEHPTSGTITIENGNIKNVDITLSEKRITKNDKGEIIYFPCTKVSGEENTIGSKYECEVSPGVKYNFYVLSYNDENNETTKDKTKAVTTNLIMDRNMCSDGTPTDESKEDKCFVAWNKETGKIGNRYGPVTAMNYLYNATKSWINIPSLNYIYNDRNFQGIAEDNTTIGYTSFVSVDGEAIITSLDGITMTTIGSKTEPLKARMPIYTKNFTNPSKNELSNKKTDNSNAYLYDYLDPYDGSKANSISGIYGYWALSSRADLSSDAWHVSFNDSVGVYNAFIDSSVGVRPVITLGL